MEIFDDVSDGPPGIGSNAVADPADWTAKDAEILQSGLHILNYAHSVEALYEGILSVLTKIVPFSDAAILMPSPGFALETVVNHAGKLDIQLAAPEGGLGKLLEGETILVEDFDTLDGWERVSASSTTEFSSGLFLPLETRDEPAVIVCVHVERAIFEETHLRSLKTFAPIAAQAVQWAKQRHAMEQHSDHLEELVRERTQELDEQKERLAQSLEKELELNGLQRQFVSMVCHEFRTPLAIIDGSAQRVSRRLEKITPERILDNVGKIRTSVVRLTNLIESMLDAARLEAGSLKFEPEPSRFDVMLEEVCSNYRELNPNYPIISDVSALPDSIFADVKLIRQAVSNLVANAVKYSPEGTKVWVQGAATEQGDVLISVRDDGVGIPPSEVKKLFDRFYRASTSTGIVGTGIGLHLVKTMVDLHGGRVDVESERGAGTTFTIHLPQNQGERPEPENEGTIKQVA